MGREVPRTVRSQPALCTLICADAVPLGPMRTSAAVVSRAVTRPHSRASALTSSAGRASTSGSGVCFARTMSVARVYATTSGVSSWRTTPAARRRLHACCARSMGSPSATLIRSGVTLRRSAEMIVSTDALS